MAQRFASRTVRRSGPMTTVETTSSYEGGLAYKFDSKTELFMRATTSLLGDSFYESAEYSEGRIVALVHKVAAEDPDWVAKFALFLRYRANLRSVAILVACEYVAAFRGHVPKGRITGRKVIAKVVGRADEAGEIIGYWHSRYGRSLPAAIQRGLSDVVNAHFTERNALKYDGQRQKIRMGDVVELVHPKPWTGERSELFKYLLDRRHRPKEARAGTALATIRSREIMEAIPPSERRDLVQAVADGVNVPATAHWYGSAPTWEWLSGWLPGGMDAMAWEAIIPHMGYMALLRNLRNFDDARVSEQMREWVARRLADADEVARSRQFPFRFWSAYLASKQSMRWGHVLSTALDLSCANIPTFEGRTLVLVDTSGSMTGKAYSDRSMIMPIHAAAVFMAAIAKRNPGAVDVVQFATTARPFGQIEPGASSIALVDRMHGDVGKVGYGTDIARGMRHWNGHDRVFVISDFQSAGVVQVPSENTIVYAVNVAGYGQSSLALESNVIGLSGLSDATFRLVPMIEAGKSGDWESLFVDLVQ